MRGIEEGLLLADIRIGLKDVSGVFPDLLVAHLVLRDLDGGLTGDYTLNFRSWGFNWRGWLSLWLNYHLFHLRLLDFRSHFHRAFRLFWKVVFRHAVLLGLEDFGGRFLDLGVD